MITPDLPHDNTLFIGLSIAFTRREPEFNGCVKTVKGVEANFATVFSFLDFILST